MAARVNWSKFDPLIMAGSMSLKEIAALVGCSYTAILKRQKKLAAERADAEAAAVALPIETDAAEAREAAEDYESVFVAVNAKTKKARIMLSSKAADIDAGEVEVLVNYERNTRPRNIERAALNAVMVAVKAELSIPLVVDMTNDGRARRNWIRFIAEYRTRPARRGN